MSKKIYHETMSALENSLTCSLISSDLFTAQNSELEPMGIKPVTSDEKEIHAYAKSKGFSCVPLYVEKNNLTPPYWFNEIFTFDRLNDKNCTRRDIKPEDIISSSTPISKLIGLFNNNDGKKRNFYLVLENERICKIVTIADLNKLPVRVCLSTMIAHLEGLMAEIIKERHTEDAWLNLLEKKIQTKINGFFTRKKRQDFDVSKLDCTTISEKFAIFSEAKDLMNLLELEDNSILGDIKDARDLLAHNQKLKKMNDIDWLSRTISAIGNCLVVLSRPSINPN